MAAGDLIGSINYSITSLTVSPGPNNGRTVQANLAGKAGAELPVEGEAIGTLTVVGEQNATSGTWSWCGFTAHADGALNSDATGTWENAGPGKIRMHGTVLMSDGQTLGCDMLADLATRSVDCKVLALS